MSDKSLAKNLSRHTTGIMETPWTTRVQVDTQTETTESRIYNISP